MTYFEGLQMLFERLARLAGHAAGIDQRGIELELIATAIEAEHIEGDELMSVAETLRAAAASARSSAEAVNTAIQSAIARLSDNPTAADIEAVVADLNAAKAASDAALTAADTIDPDVTTGGVVDDGSGGVVEPPA